MGTLRAEQQSSLQPIWSRLSLREVHWHGTYFTWQKQRSWNTNLPQWNLLQADSARGLSSVSNVGFTEKSSQVTGNEQFISNIHQPGQSSIFTRMNKAFWSVFFFPLEQVHPLELIHNSLRDLPSVPEYKLDFKKKSPLEHYVQGRSDRNHCTESWKIRS